MREVTLCRIFWEVEHLHSKLVIKTEQWIFHVAAGEICGTECLHKALGHRVGSLLCLGKDQELGSVIFVGPFQPWTFHDSMVLWHWGGDLLLVLPGLFPDSFLALRANH